ncbi:hypothetical protein BBNG_00151 [Bifidobacterium bifidum NCIMB 41171]|nr:hypothetical protein BBNG_00151 [Bifidobacterium bifidum NCIMB 41171]
MRAETTTVRTYGRKSGLLRPYVRALVVSARTYGRFGSAPNLAPLDSPLSAGVRPTLPLAGLSQSDWGGSHVTRYVESSNVSSKSSPANPPHM